MSATASTERCQRRKLRRQDPAPHAVFPPSAEGLPLDFSLPQFDSSIGRLQSVLLTVNVGPSPITGNNVNVTLSPADQGVDLSFGAAGSFSTGGSTYQLDFGGLAEFVLFPHGGQEGSPENVFIAMPAYFPPASNAFVGTGNINFDVASMVILNEFTANSVDVTVDQQLNATVD